MTKTIEQSIANMLHKIKITMKIQICENKEAKVKREEK